MKKKTQKYPTHDRCLLRRDFNLEFSRKTRLLYETRYIYGVLDVTNT